jgi:hypothetical protein
LTPTLESHVRLSVAFVLARLVLYAAGLRMNFDIRWMWLADPADLTQHFWHTVLYFHAMPPGMNALTAVCLWLGGKAAGTVALVVFAGFSLVLANAILYLGRALGLPARLGFGLALGFGLTPPALFFDHLYLYESPVVSLLGLSAALFARALRVRTRLAWLACFGCLAAIGLTRSTFHLVWLLGLVGLSLLLVAPEGRKALLVGALGPVLLLASLYLKNEAIFGHFEALSEGPLNLNLVTVRQLRREERDEWIAQGKLSPLAALDVFAGPREYLPFFPSPNNPKYPPELSRLERPTNGAPNFNHWFYVEAMPKRQQDAFVYLREKPLGYVQTVLRGVRDFFGATTRWHPREGSGKVTPHDAHRVLLGGYERAYNALLHGLPFPPVGWYLFLPFPLVWASLRARALRRAGDGTEREQGALLCFLLCQVVYVTAASTLFTYQESSRYRYQIEPFIWLLAAFTLVGAWRRRAR